MQEQLDEVKRELDEVKRELSDTQEELEGIRNENLEQARAVSVLLLSSVHFTHSHPSQIKRLETIERTMGAIASAIAAVS